MNFNEGVVCFFEILNEVSDNYIYMCDMRTGTFRYSKHLVDIFPLPGEVLHDALSVWKEIVHPQDWERFYQSNLAIGKDGNDSHAVEFRGKTYDGEYIWLRCSGKVVRDEKGEPFLFGGIMAELGQKNKRDALLNLYTREAFLTKTDLKCTESDSTQFAMIHIDIDDLKVFNEVYDRVTGDFVIKKVEDLVQEIVAENSLVYTLEANRIGILIDNVTKELVSKFYQQVQLRIAEEPSLRALEYPVRVSAGCAFYPQDADNGKTLVKNCEQALQYAKENGKNRLVYFSTEILAARKRRFALRKYLDRSVRTHFVGFQLYYQPQVDTETGAIWGTEALLRWECEELGMLSPLEFIPILEETELIIPVGLWVLRKAMQDCQKWLAYNPDFMVSVNVSPLQIMGSDFITEVKNLIAEEELSPSHVILELTESCMVENTELLKSVLVQLHDMGFQVAIDDFGTGYSSLGILRTLQADVVKIDKIFIRDILNNQLDRAFIHSITELCHSIGMKVLQEGVEEENELAILQPMGFDYLQGFLFGRPQKAAQITEQLSRKSQKGECHADEK